MWLLLFFCSFSVCSCDIQGATHWMVTESGLIQPKTDSPFEMARPYDLLAFLNQDTRWENIHTLYEDLTKRQTDIKSLWGDAMKFSNVNEQILNNKNCEKIGSIDRLDWYTSHLEDGTSKQIPAKELKLTKPGPGQDTEVPDCKKISSLTYSMSAYEHLEGVIQRENLTADPELALPELISPIMNADQYGHWINQMLKTNSTSWLHYNMASLYWRIRGNAHKAMECSRRAVHYSPRRYKDVPLLSMGIILHRSKMLDDALVVLGAAVDHDPKSALNRFILGNACAVKGDFNMSLRQFDKCVKLDPSFEHLTSKHTYGVLCHASVFRKMNIVKKILTKLRYELSEYSIREAHWLKSQAAFLKTMKHTEEYDYRNIEKNCEKIQEITGLKIKELKKRGDKSSLILYFLDSPMYDETWFNHRGVFVMESANNLHRFIMHVESHANKPSDFLIQSEQLKLSDGTIMNEIGPMPVLPDITRGKLLVEEISESQDFSNKPISSQPDSDLSEFETGIVMYPPTMKVRRNKEDFDREPEWPSNKLCKGQAAQFPDNVEAVYPVFMPFENKGIRVKGLLTDKIGVPASQEHELPWHPPVCPQDKGAHKKLQKQQVVPEVVPTEYLRQKLMEYVGNGNAELARHMEDAEIGQRIHTAMEKSAAPKWLTHTLASLYWRVRGNNVNALNCLLAASRSVKARYRDVVLASLSSVYIEMGYFDESLAAVEEAFRLSMYEPATNFLIAELNMIKKHRNTHMFHLKQVLRVDEGFMGGLARRLLVGWACLLKQVNALQLLADVGEGDVCTQVEPGMSMVCEKDGTNCHFGNIRCFTSHEKVFTETSTLVRMLDQEDFNREHTIHYMDPSVFDAFINDTPRDSSDRAGHAENYERMMGVIDKTLKGCGTRGCSNIKSEDLALKEEDCTYQHLQLGYWLHIISFRQLVSDSELRLPPEIPTMQASNKKVPECRLFSNPADDFYLDRLSKVDTEGWEPVLSLMHQFAEMFDYFDYLTLGAKLAKYVETKPRSWRGLVGAGWWCGAGGRGACAVRCLTAAYAAAPDAYASYPLRALAQLLHMQSKQQDAKDVAYLTFYMSPKSKVEAFLVAVSHTYLAEYEQAVWMYRYALHFDEKFLPAKACLHATMCLLIYGDIAKELNDYTLLTNQLGELGRRLRQRGCDPRSGLYLVQRISVAIQRGNAAGVMGTFGSGASRNEIP